MASFASVGLGGNNALLRAITKELRDLTAAILAAQGERHLVIEGKRLVKADALLQQAGFACVWDNNNNNNTDALCTRNWPANAPPPATHWSGTVIDYAYYRPDKLRNVGTFVSPAACSDHRLIVTDWALN